MLSYFVVTCTILSYPIVSVMYSMHATFSKFPCACGTKIIPESNSVIQVQREREREREVFFGGGGGGGGGVWERITIKANNRDWERIITIKANNRCMHMKVIVQITHTLVSG